MLRRDTAESIQGRRGPTYAARPKQTSWLTQERNRQM
jgi:hypothetical protein